MNSNNSTTSNVITSSTGETFNLNKRSLDVQASSFSSSQLTKLDNLTALEENLQKQLAAHKKILTKIKDGNQKIKKMKDILCVQRRLNDIKRDKLQFTKEEKSFKRHKGQDSNMSKVILPVERVNRNFPVTTDHRESSNNSAINVSVGKKIDQRVAATYDDYDEPVDFEDDSDDEY